MDVNSGMICAIVVSMLSIRSTSTFLMEPDGMSSTVPKGTRESFAQTRLRMLPSTAKVALWESVVEML